MTTEVQVQETIARCVSIMVFYHNDHEASDATERMIAEVQLVAGWITEMELSPGGTDWLIFGPLENELYARFGHEVAPRLYAEFIEAIESLNIPS
jgi:hypothetical protein